MSYLVQAASGSFRVLGEVSGELSPASVYVGLLPVGEACVVAACWSRPGFELINDYGQ